MNQGLSMTTGIISNPRVTIRYLEISREVIQSIVSISHGNSGGALIDAKSNLAGITTFRIKDNMGNIVYGFVYSIPIDIVVNYIETVLEN